MPQLSEKRKEKISEQILHYLFTIAPEPAFTNKVAYEVARDEEFTKTLLKDLAKKNLVIEIKKSPKGEDYELRRRWRLSNEAFNIYKKHQRPN